jgi:hypothetical protein
MCFVHTIRVHAGHTSDIRVWSMGCHQAEHSLGQNSLGVEKDMRDGILRRHKFPLFGAYVHKLSREPLIGIFCQIAAILNIIRMYHRISEQPEK